MKDYKYTNELIHAASPYLLEHAHNPVNWYPWGEAAFEKANKENKFIIISIGYSACHWCHVMMHETFEDTLVARYMNDNFIPVKVDREERPDIDQVYMNAVQLLTGGGGWPLNVIAMPDGRPFFGGTYFRRDKWLQVLQVVSEYSRESPGKIEEQAEALSRGVRSKDIVKVPGEGTSFTENDLKIVFDNWKGSFDDVNGGYNGAPKFPLPVGYQFLLYYNYLTGDRHALSAVTTTLDKMSEGGIYDQLGGGFARYSTDASWKVPHFEKMLYDNAQLVSLYSAAYQHTKDPRYRDVVYETLDFVKRELSSPEGGLYSSLDADSEGEEGRYYVWTSDEIRKITGSYADIVSAYFNITGSGNWENGRNILYRSLSDKLLAEKHKISEKELKEKIARAKKLLFNARSGRILPAVDEKIISAWNALMIKGYSDAWRAFGNPEFLDAARKNAGFMLKNMVTAEGRVYRIYKDGSSSVNGFLDDYAYTIDALISLCQSTFDEKWLLEARLLTDYAIQHFYDSTSGMFYYTSDLDPGLIARKMEIIDNVMPSSNSVMARNLFILGTYYDNEDYRGKSGIMLNNVKKDALKGGPYYANWDILIAWFARQPYDVAIVGPDYPALMKDFSNYYLPDVLFYGGKDDKSGILENKLIPKQTTIYVCRNRSCGLPVTKVSEALKQIKR